MDSNDEIFQQGKHSLSNSLIGRDKGSFHIENYLQLGSKLTNNPNFSDFRNFLCIFCHLFERLRGLEY